MKTLNVNGSWILDDDSGGLGTAIVNEHRASEGISFLLKVEVI